MAFIGTLIKNAGDFGYNSAFPDGDAPVPTSGINIIGTVANGNLIEIIAGDDVDFGSLQPDHLFCTNLAAANAAGGDFELVEGTTVDTGFIATAPAHYNGAFKLPIKTVAGLPNNKGIAIGDLRDELAIKAGSTVGGAPDFSGVTGIPPEFGQIEVIAYRKSHEMMISYITVWPADEQENMMANSVLNEQTKIIWHYNGVDGHGGIDSGGTHNAVLNLFVGMPSGHGGGSIDSQPYVINSSTSVSITIVDNAISTYTSNMLVGDTVELSNLSSVGTAGSAVVVDITSNIVTVTVSGWPSSGSGALTFAKKGKMQSARLLSANGSAFIADTNTQYTLDKNGTVANPYAVDSTHQNSNILIHQVWVRSHPDGNETWTRIIQKGVGEIYQYVENHDRVGTMNPTRDTFEYMHLIGNSQGVNVNFIDGNPITGKGKCSYLGDQLQQYGTDSAFFRVEISDAADHGTGVTEMAWLRIYSVSNKRIVGRVLGGSYGTGDLTGEYLHVMNGTTKLASKQI